VIASEGGHADFAPRSEIEIDLLNHLLKRHKRVSYERVLSGPGLMNVYSFLKDCRYETEPDWLAAKLETGDDKAKVISDAALAGDDAAIAVRTLDLFVSVYGAQAGNLALTFNATGGVFLGGGIAPKISAKLLDGTFMKSYVNKGRLSPLVEAAPVKIVMKPKTALLGAARYAAEHAHG
jgi:glucokinase